MLAAVQRDEDERPGFIVISNDNRDESEPFIVKKPHSFDFSRTIYSIIENERVHDFVLGAGVALAGMGLKAAFATAAHATGASALILVGAATVGFGKGLYTAWKNDWYKDDENKSVFKEVFKSTALATIGGAFAMFALPGLAEGFQHLTQNFNLGNMFAGLGGLWPFGKPELPAAPSVPAPPASVAPQAVIDAPVDVTPDAAVDAVPPPVEVPAISEQWQAIEAAAEAGDAHSQKDLAMSLFNGRNGFEVDRERALELFRSSAEAGNIQAKVDLAYIEYHGLAGVQSNHEEAIAAMRELAANDTRAAALLEQWAPAPEAAPVVEIAAVQPTVAPLAGTDLTMSFEIQADGNIGGVIHNAAGIIAPGTVFEVPVSQISLN